MTRQFACWLSLFALAACLSSQELPSGYLVRDLGPYPDRLAAGPGFAPASLNDRGTIVGWAYSGFSQHAFRWDDGVLTDLGVLPGAPPFFRSIAAAVNNKGQIVGQAQAPSDLTLHPVLFDGGQVLDLGVPVPIREDSTAAAINDAGQIVGGTWFSGGQMHAYLYDKGVMTDLGLLPGGRLSGATGINNVAQVVGGADFLIDGRNGQHAFLYGKRGMVDLGALPLGFQFSVASGINDAGQIVGVSACATPDHAFLYANGTMTDLGTFGGPLSSATSINQQGIVVGGADVAPDSSHAFVFASGVMHDLNDMVPPAIGRTLVDALAINNRGQILAIGYVQSEFHSFLLDPPTLGQFHTITPCRVADTREPVAENGGPALTSNTDRAFRIGGKCGLPATAQAVAFNFVVTQPSGQGSITVFPADDSPPNSATLSFRAGQTRANNGILAISSAGRITVHLDQPGGTAHLVVDVSGYFE